MKKGTTQIEEVDEAGLVTLFGLPNAGKLNRPMKNFVKDGDIYKVTVGADLVFTVVEQFGNWRKLSDEELAGYDEIGMSPPTPSDADRDGALNAMFRSGFMMRKGDAEICAAKWTTKVKYQNDIIFEFII